MMCAKIAEEDISKEYKGGDQDTDALDLEMLLYFSKNTVERKKKDIILTAPRNDKNICLRGDNLITKKTMYRRIFSHSQGEYPNSKIENDNHIYSFILMPHIKGKAKCQINSYRASIGDYNDNPFIFFNTLKSLYHSDFENESGDKVEYWIVKNKDFWKLFGNGDDGYKNYLKTFCLEEIEEIMEYCDCRYKKFFIRGYIPQQWEQKEWTEYVKILYCLRDERMKSLKKRVIQISKEFSTSHSEQSSQF